MLLENPPENPCFGCGPNHPRGLRLQFEREGDVVRTRYAPKDDEIGWPTLFHTGLHVTVLFEASYWAALELTGKVHTATGTQQFTQERLPRTGAPFLVEARIVGRDPLRTEAKSFRQDGKPCATLASGWRPGSRAATERAGVRLPGYLLEEMDP